MRFLSERKDIQTNSATFERNGHILQESKLFLFRTKIVRLHDLKNDENGIFCTLKLGSL